MKTALLITNGFLISKKFDEIYGFLSRAAASRGVRILHMKNNELILPAHDAEGLKSCVEYCVKRKYPDITDIDFIIFWDKDLLLAESLETAGFKLYNSFSSIRDCDNKALTYNRLRMGGLPLIPTIFAPMTYSNIGYVDTDFLKQVGEQLGFPLVIKECCGSFGMQVYLANDLNEAADITKKHGFVPLLYQKFISYRKGTDIRINMVGQNAAASMLRSNPSDFRANITIGGHMEKYEPSDFELTISRHAVRLLGLDFGGVDIIMDKDGMRYICEVNSNAHFKNIYDLTGVDVAEHIIDHILKMER